MTAYLDLTEILTHPNFYSHPCYLQVSNHGPNTAEEKSRHQFLYYKSMGNIIIIRNRRYDPANVRNRPICYVCSRYLQAWNGFDLTQPRHDKRMRAICCHGNQTSYPIFRNI